MRVTLLLFLAAVAGLPSAARAASAGQARISYLAGASVYLDAGRSEGLAVGDSATVTRNGRSIARLRVAVVSTHRASCDTLWTREALAIGDAVTFEPRAVPAAPEPAAATSARDDSIRAAALLAAPGESATRSRSFMRGRLGVRWLETRTDASGRMQQPALEARFDGRDQWNGHLDATLDVRGRRTVRTTSAGQVVDQYSRVHRAALTLRDRVGAYRLSLGRQSAPTLASVSVFDGALAERAGTRHTLGLFGGTQPEPARFGWSHALVQGGAFVEWRQAPLAATRWALALGGVTTRDHGEPDRDFAFAQASWSARGASALLAQEMDWNPAWKRARGERTVSWTSTFATVNVPVGSRFALRSGYDNRRNVLLWRDHDTPEDQFDDRYRQGAWLGFSFEPDRRARFGAEYRGGSMPDRSDTWTVTGELRGPSRWREMARGRWSSFSNDALESGLWSGALGCDPWPGAHLEVVAGRRSTTDRFSGFDDSASWEGVDLDVALLARWYLTGGFEAQHGAAGDTRQLQAGLSVRL